MYVNNGYANLVPWVTYRGIRLGYVKSCREGYSDNVSHSRRTTWGAQYLRESSWTPNVLRLQKFAALNRTLIDCSRQTSMYPVDAEFGGSAIILGRKQ